MYSDTTLDQGAIWALTQVLSRLLTQVQSGHLTQVQSGPMTQVQSVHLTQVQSGPMRPWPRCKLDPWPRRNLFIQMGSVCRIRKQSERVTRDRGIHWLIQTAIPYCYCNWKCLYGHIKRKLIRLGVHRLAPSSSGEGRPSLIIIVSSQFYFWDFLRIIT